MSAGKFKFAIDRGGTFTDVYAICPDGKERVTKLLSVDPSNYPDAPREGIRRILEEELGNKMPANEPVDTSMIDWIRMGTTVATNALLERKGERMALVITSGFRDLLYIGNQARPKIFDLKIEMPEGLYEAVVEAKERVILDSPRCQLTAKGRQVDATNGEKLWIIEELDQEHLKRELEKIHDKGISSIAVVLMHSYIYPAHEEIIEKIARSVGIESVSLSSKIMPMMRIVPRGFTAASDAYLTPHIQRYLQGFCSGFKNELDGVNVLFMQSDGGLTPMDSFSGSRAILSGPAGGVVGYARTLYGSVSNGLPVIGFDMGGTSTDVSRYDGAWEHVFETTTAGVTIQAPQLDVNTVAAGGGSMLFFRDGMFVVGPDSAGAHPGPTCYKKGGPLTVTDANLRLGRLIPEYFPKIFGKHENEPLDSVATAHAFQQLTQQVNELFEMTEEEVAMGFINVANEAMCRPIRALTQAKGHDTSRHILACFGGAGGQHACAIARSLGMKVVLIHRYSGILSAYGMALADVVREEQEACSKPYEIDNFEYIDQRVDVLSKRCRESLISRGFQPDQIHTEPYLHMRYDRTDCALLCGPADPGSSSRHMSSHGDFLESFVEKYKTEFGFTIDERPVIVDDIRVRGIAKTGIQTTKTLPAATSPATSVTMSPIYFEGGYRDCSVFLLKDLLPGHSIPGPAMIIDQLGTIIVEPNSTAELTVQGDLRITIHDAPTSSIGLELDAVQLSIFSHRFMSIAEQMGRILQRTAVSTNIKERLDFSCALFGPDGGLVSNAPHIPVHLGAMQEAVQYQLRARGSDILPGDVFLSNHPSAGGSHLPDLTVITPVFWEKQQKPVFYVASRGHHADIGGITPGSMPPHSHMLNEEGAVFKSFVLVRDGVFREAELIDALNAPGKIDIPGASGTRNLHDNLSDLRAQVAANQKGIGLVSELMVYYGLEVVQQYMGYVRHNAEMAVRSLLKEVAQKSGQKLEAEDFMDDGSRICLSVAIDPSQGSATFDFTGTGCQVWGNTNAPRAVSLSAIIYCLRSLVGHDIPLNQGCLVPIQVIIPDGCLLNPYPEAGVVGGNVLTSQRVVDVVLRAFGACAASQGCMNNITFGDETMGYYETVAGGSGAGPDWNGRSGIHSHMTNTRITDAEVLERRYPVILRSFCLRNASGGHGKYRGGDGISRELLFRQTMTLSVLTERRVYAPYGLAGGGDGAKGSNSLLRRNGVLLNLGAKCSVPIHAGDSFRLLTPGGGGYGVEDKEGNKPVVTAIATKFTERGSVYEFRSLQESA